MVPDCCFSQLTAFYVLCLFLIDLAKKLKCPFHFFSCNFTICLCFLYISIQPDTSKLGRYIDSITDQMVHKNEYDEFAHFFENRTGIFNSIQQTVQQSLETIHINNEWQQRNYENIGRLLTEY